MVDIKDVRRISITAAVLAAVLVLWLFFLWLHEQGYWEWALPRKALASVAYGGWMWIGAGLFMVLLAVVALPVFGVPEVAKASEKGRLRQVQCQNCKAVFVIPDNGRRPLTHQCPSCKYLGVYTGEHQPAGDLPEPEVARRVTKIDLTCGNCRHKFKVTDTGRRPLKIACPDCQAIGHIE